MTTTKQKQEQNKSAQNRINPNSINPNIESLYQIQGCRVALDYLITMIYDGNEDADIYSNICEMADQTVISLKDFIFEKLATNPNVVYKMLGCVDMLDAFIDKLQNDDPKCHDYQETYSNAKAILVDLDELTNRIYNN